MKFLSFGKLFGIFKKEMIQIFRDKVTMKLIITFPLIQIILYGYGINTDPRNLPTAVLNYDKSSIISRNIISSMENSGYFKIVQEIQNHQEGKELLQRGDVNFVLTIPENFSKNLIKMSANPSGNAEKPIILIEADATDPVAVSAPLGYFSQIISSAIEKDEFPLHFIDPRSSDKDLVSSSFSNPQIPYEIRIHKLYNEESISNWNTIPGLLAIILTFTCLNLASISFAKEREAGTIENLLSLPLTPLEIMIGKTLPFMIIGYFQSIIVLCFSFFLFKIPILGSLTILMIAMFFFIACNLVLGYTISIKAKNQMQAMQSAVFIFVPSILLSGFVFPFAGMPLWARILGNIIPATHFIRISKGIMLKGSSLSETIHHFWPLLAFLCFAIYLGITKYKKTLD